MAATGHDMRAVELVEDDGAPHAGGPRRSAARTAPPALAAASAPPSPPPEPGRVRRRRTAAAVTLLVVGIVLGDAAGDARARAGLAALSGVEGVVARLDAPVTELWRADPGLRPELGEAGGRLVGVLGERGAADVVGLDPATGTVVWRTVVREAGPGDGGTGVRCVTPRPPAEPRGGVAAPVPTVVCVVDRAAHPHPAGEPDPAASAGPAEAHPAAADPADATDDRAEPAGPAHGRRHAAPEDRLLTLDARTGTLLADRTVERSTVLAELGEDVVVGHVDHDGRVHVVRMDPFGEEVRWSFVSPDPLPRSHLAWATRIGVERGVVVVDEADGWALSADGQVLHGWTGSTAEQLAGTTQVVGAGRFLSRPEPTSGPWPRSLVTDLRTDRSFVVAGRPLPTWPDDGTADERLLVRTGESDGLVAYDASGTPRWSVPGNVQGRAMVVDGRLLRIGTGDLSAIDARTGAVLWSTPLVRTARISLLTDGRRAVVTRLDPDDGVVLSAYGLDDGRPRWTVDLADDVSAVTAFDGRLFGWTGEQLVALGAPGG